MTHTYSITGMTCSGCEAKVEEILSGLDGVKHVDIDLAKGEATIEMQKHILTETLQQALKDYPKYQLSESHHVEAQADEKRNWFQTYKPVLLIFAYLLGVSFLVEAKGQFEWSHWMNNFMGGFFVTFSFFKMLDLKGFAESYFSYDVVAKRWFTYGYVYAFIELALGLAYLTSFRPLLTNSLTFIIMTLSIIGVLQSVFNKRKIKCACLGTVFNLPMSTITIMEDGLMIGMSLVSLLTLTMYE